MGWAQGAEIATVGAFHDKRGPACIVGSLLRSQARTDCVEAVRWQASDVLGVVGCVGQSKRNWKGDEVNIADVDEDLRAVVGELAEVLKFCQQ